MRMYIKALCKLLNQFELKKVLIRSCNFNYEKKNESLSLNSLFEYQTIINWLFEAFQIYGLETEQLPKINLAKTLTEVMITHKS